MNATASSVLALPLALLFLVSSCDRRNDSKSSTAGERKEAATFQLPTATEVFRLRSECSRLAEKIRDDQLGFRISKILSHYDPETNRCYVELTRTDSGRTDHQLYDGQTSELLAVSSMGSGNRAGGAEHGVLTLPNGDEASFKAVEDFIEKTMADDRRR